MAYIGKLYKMEKQEGLEPLCESLKTKIPEQLRQVMLANSSSTKITKDGDQYTLVSGAGDMTFDVPFKNGVELDDNIVDQPVKTKFVVDGNTITQTYNFVNTGVVITFKRDFNGDELITTITSNTFEGAGRKYLKA